MIGNIDMEDNVYYNKQSYHTITQLFNSSTENCLIKNCASFD